VSDRRTHARPTKPKGDEPRFPFAELRHAPRRQHRSQVLSVGDLARSKDFYGEVLGPLGFKLKYDHVGMVGWSNRKTLFWTAQADAQGKKRKHRKGDIGFHHPLRGRIFGRKTGFDFS
jgi:catechol 2,3-dioxygenase-like lactoylglutathione lyase family enzyme